MISDFRGEYRWLSNFYPVTVELDGVLYPSVEHAYQAAKTLDPVLRESFQRGTAGEVKRLGNKLVLRPDWDSVRLQVMESLLRQKFAKYWLRDKLLATGDQELVEGNWWGDTYWGVCRGVGQNHLGKLLMLIRRGG